ncbi:hypothetical protein CQW23_01652 [Capsicum baccatum]|uniref:Uncharacterized protein n=1 Tax=Capsicum baccatum TaxID=33114 RepID=A0A2G2XPB3_CAPBA|nr:hypothetical protein CQW23_01652 [Capsicum baccatum]
MPRVVRIYMTDNDAPDSSSDEEEMLQGEKSQRTKKLWIKEIMIENGRTRVISKKKSKEKKLLQFLLFTIHFCIRIYEGKYSNPTRMCVRLAIIDLRMGKVRTKEVRHYPAPSKKKFAVKAKPKTAVKPKAKPVAKAKLNAKSKPKAAPGNGKAATETAEVTKAVIQ